jgi:hypothetical protein
MTHTLSISSAEKPFCFDAEDTQSDYYDRIGRLVNKALLAPFGGASRHNYFYPQSTASKAREMFLAPFAGRSVEFCDAYEGERSYHSDNDYGLSIAAWTRSLPGIRPIRPLRIARDFVNLEALQYMRCPVTASPPGNLVRNVLNLDSLPFGWDGGKALQISQATIRSSLAVLNFLYLRASTEGLNLNAPSASPTPEGSVQLEWDLDTGFMSVEIPRSGELVSFYIDPKDGEERDEFAKSPEDLWTAIRVLQR